MKRIVGLQAFLVCILLCRCVDLHAQTLVGGDILSSTSFTAAFSPYRVTSNIRVGSGVTLNIEPGVQVMFDPGTGITVEGSLVVLGTSLDSVLLKSFLQQPDTSSWEGIALSGGTVRFAFVKLSNARLGISASASTSVTDLNLSNCEFRECALGIAAVPSGLSVRECAFKENHVGSLGSDLIFNRCSFAANEVGISGGLVVVDSCTFTKHRSSAVRGAAGKVNGSLFILNTIGLDQFGNSPTDTIQGCQFAENDTAVVALGNRARFFENEFCANLVQVRVADSWDADFRGNCWCSLDTSYIATTFVDGRTNTGLGHVLLSPIDTRCNVVSQVWPGDANDDGVATIADMLYVGVAFNLTGPGRADATASWTGQTGLPWDYNFDFGTNYKHSDCDGDGRVELSDTLPIVQNLGQIHYKTSGMDTLGGTLVVVEFPSFASAGEQVAVNVSVGNSNFPADGVYGVCLVLRLDSSVFANAYSTSLNDSWLGSAGSDLIDLDLWQGGLHWAIVRNDQTDRSGYGKMGGVTLVMIDDLTAPVQLDSFVTLEQVLLIDKKGNEIPSDAQLIFVPACSDNQVSVCPTVANQRMEVMLNGITAESMELYGPNGLMAFRQTGPISGTQSIDSRQFQPGMYVLRVNLTNGSLTRKVFVLR